MARDHLHIPMPGGNRKLSRRNLSEETNNPILMKNAS